MFNVWWELAFASARLCQEAQEVVNLRLMKIAFGGNGSHSEAHRMVSEKSFALAEAVGTLVTGGSIDKVLRRYRSHVRANKRRLMRGFGSRF
jgi:hypothetical protein